LAASAEEDQRLGVGGLEVLLELDVVDLEGQVDCETLDRPAVAPHVQLHVKPVDERGLLVACVHLLDIEQTRVDRIQVHRLLLLLELPVLLLEQFAPHLQNQVPVFLIDLVDRAEHVAHVIRGQVLQIQTGRGAFH